MTKEKEIEIGDSKLVQRESETPKKINFQDRQLFKKFNQPWVNKLKKKEHFRVISITIAIKIISPPTQKHLGCSCR